MTGLRPEQAAEFSRETTKPILERLRIAPTITLPQEHGAVGNAAVIRQMMVERAEAADVIEELLAVCKFALEHGEDEPTEARMQLLTAISKAERPS